jgi:hypothetical protein
MRQHFVVLLLAINGDATCQTQGQHLKHCDLGLACIYMADGASFTASKNGLFTCRLWLLVLVQSSCRLLGMLIVQAAPLHNQVMSWSGCL